MLQYDNPRKEHQHYQGVECCRDCKMKLCAPAEESKEKSFILELPNASQLLIQLNPDPVDNYMFKVNNRNTRTRCGICSKLTIKTPERRSIILVYLLLTLNIFHTLF